MIEAMKHFQSVFIFKGIIIPSKARAQRIYSEDAGSTLALPAMELISTI